MAVALAHQDHLRGVGTALLHQLAQVARSKGIRFFTAYVLAENAPMLKVLRDIGRHDKKLPGQCSADPHRFIDRGQPRARPAAVKLVVTD